MAEPATAHPFLGKFVIVRCRDAGVHAGTLAAAEGRSCHLTGSRRLWYWKAAKEAFLSGVARHGLDQKASKVGGPVDIHLTEDCEIILATDDAAANITGAAIYEPR